MSKETRPCGYDWDKCAEQNCSEFDQQLNDAKTLLQVVAEDTARNTLNNGNNFTNIQSSEN